MNLERLTLLAFVRDGKRVGFFLSLVGFASRIIKGRGRPKKKMKNGKAKVGMVAKWTTTSSFFHQ
jgi:hypothetical protein